MGVNLPVVLCANKSDSGLDSERTLHDEFIPVLKEFKEVESCIRCSARDKYNINQAFYLCQRAVTHPISPLYDAKEGNLKQDAVDALMRIFFLCDKDQDGVLNEQEFLALQMKCFGRGLDINDIAEIKNTVNEVKPEAFSERGLTEEGFLILNKIFAERGRHETTWGILRTFHYTDSLSLNDKFLLPKLDIPRNSSVELSPIGYRFFVDLFLLFDKDNDGGLNNFELKQLFKPTPGIPETWIQTNFPDSTVRNEQGHVTLQGWLAQWSMTTFLDYKVTLAYLAYLGFESKNGLTTSALKTTKPRRERTKNGSSVRVNVNDRTVFNCFVLGGPKSGKSSLLEAFLGRQYSEIYNPTIRPRIVVNSVELKGGKQVYLILEELGRLEPAILDNESRLMRSCDVLCMAYDSSDPESFHYITELFERHPLINKIPTIIVALKADLDRQQQRCDVQPEEFTQGLFLPLPLHVSSTWSSSVSELFVQLVEVSFQPSKATPGLEPEVQSDHLSSVVIGASAVGFLSVLTLSIYKLTFSRN